jgi:hypothetical protein
VKKQAFVTLTILMPAAMALAGALAPTGLLCELLCSDTSKVIEDAVPEFSWICNSTASAETQTACQIIVADSRASIDNNSGTVWNSGWISSSQSVNVPYAGPALAANSCYWWKVRTRLSKGGESAYSEPSQMCTGSLTQAYATSCHRVRTAEIAPRLFVPTGAGHYFVDFGKTAFGTVTLTINSPAAGGTVTVHLGEKSTGTAVDRNPGGTIRYRSIPLTLKQGLQHYHLSIPTLASHTSNTKTIRVPEGLFEVTPFRFCELEGVPGTFDTSSIRQIATFYPFDENASSFTCSDQVLNDVWDLCKYSIKATSFLGVYIDGDRERTPYEADAYINQLGHYGVDREYAIGRYSHEYLLTHPTWPTEWKLHSILMAWADYLYTGNRESLEQNYAVLKSDKLLMSHARSDGLFDLTGTTPVVDWPAGERDGFVLSPVNTVINAFYYKALTLMDSIATVLGHTGDATLYRTTAAAVYTMFNQKLFNQQTGLYLDGEGQTHSSLHANMFPLAFGLVPAGRIPAVVTFIKSRGMACSVYGAQYLLEALYAAGEADYAAGLMAGRTGRSWGHMIYDLSSSITLEAWDIQYKSNLDWNHAWGAAPANIIPRRMFGIEPLEPGFAKVAIRPQTGKLPSAAITCPTIRGPVSVNVTRTSARYDVNVTMPSNTIGRVWIPKMGTTGPAVSMDGAVVDGREDGDFIVIDSVGSGQHSFSRLAEDTTLPESDINLARRGTMSATSSQASFPPALSNDNDANTFWVSQDRPESAVQYLSCDLAASYTISRVELLSRPNYGPKEVAVEISADGLLWKQVATATIANAAGPHVLEFTDTQARYVRLKVSSSYSATNTQIREMMIFGFDNPTVTRAVPPTGSVPQMVFSIKGIGPIYTGPRYGARQIVIVNLQGRIVQTIPLGSDLVSWNGLDRFGGPLPKGVYAMWLAGPAGRASRKFIVCSGH